uniref:Addiction module antidote protein, HigA family n=1 Tax=Candidatus Kentrum sp. LPFa TaxID=2126335 RepID=A0A450XYK7_9GAMM|nr:MAG: addiction module antidote protein, HigA family [Candidatus Kentron sp. LPFa]VFK34346.1 MAG: addiction module antidote protein, HigA family [Candidatus Kentron sp. LPFa]
MVRIPTIRIPTNRAPTHPGEMLVEEFLNPMRITQRELADAIHVSYQRINELVNGKRGVTPSTALRLARFFGMSVDFWLNLQVRWDLHKAQSAERAELETIKDYHYLDNYAARNHIAPLCGAETEVCQ